VRRAYYGVNRRGEGRRVCEVETFDLFDFKARVERGGVDVQALRDALAPDQLRAEQSATSRV
jgi:hypothetical protein